MNMTKLLTSCRIFIFISYCVIYSYCAQYTFTTQPHSVLVAEGEEVSLTCAWEPPLSDGHIVRWYHWPESGGIDEITSSNTNYNVFTDTSSSGQGISRLTVKSVEYITGSGQYRCEIGDPQNLLFSNYVSVGTIKCFPGNYNGEIGEPVVCSTSSSGIELRWYNKTKLIGTTSNRVLNTNSLDLGDDGVSFTCKAMSRGSESTEIGTCETTPLVLRIDATIERSPPGPLQVGDNFNLTCLTKGDPSNYEYRWRVGNRFLNSSEDYNDKRFGIGEKLYVFTYRDVPSRLNGIVISCIVSRRDRRDTIANYKVELATLMTTTSPTTKNTNKLTLTPTLHNSRSTKHEQSTTVITDGQKEPASSQTIIIVVGIVAVALIIFITILIICFLRRRRKTKNEDVKKLERVPLEEPTYDDVKEKDNDNKITNSAFGTGKLLTDLTIYDEPTISISNTKLDQPANGQDNDQLASSRTDKYDTPRKAVSVDHLDTRDTTSVEEANAMYATSTKTRSRESIDAMYAKPNKTQSKESIDDLYSKPNKSAGNTPKLEHNAQKNAEGLTYADIEFQNGNYPAPEPKDYGLDYASVQFSN